MYRFEKINEDEYKLICNDKEYTFTRTIDVAKNLQSIDMIATLKVADILAERGETYENTKLRVELKKDNKTIIDESNLRRIEKVAKNQASIEVMDNLIKKIFNMSIDQLIVELGIKTEDEGVAFTKEFLNVLVQGIPNNTP